MSWIKAYRLPFFMGLTWLGFLFAMINNFRQMDTLALMSGHYTAKRQLSGSYGKFTFKMTLKTDDGSQYARSYRNFCISNLFTDFNLVDEGREGYFMLPQKAIQGDNGDFFFFATEETNIFKRVLFMMSYVLSNQVLILVIPFFIAALFFGAEFKPGYVYRNRTQQRLVDWSKIAFTIFILLIAIY